MTTPFRSDIVVEMYLGNAWVDVSSDVYQRVGVNISRGRKDESSSPQPQTCTFTLDNRLSNYSPRWPTGIYYGTFGRNTPVRVAVRLVRDTYARTVVSGWGSADTGQAWTSGGTGGSILASDHNVAAGVGTQSVPAVTAWRIDYLAGISYSDVDIKVDVSLALASITGAAVEPANLMLRGQDSTHYYMVRVSVATSGAITVGIMLADQTVIAAAVSTGLTYAASTFYRVRAQAEGNTIRAKVWLATGSEPLGWQVTVHDTTITTGGFVGVRSGVATSNSNTKPIVFSYTSFEAKLPRFAGETSSLSSKWDVSGKDVYKEVSASGPTRRLGQGANPLQSVLRRAYLRDLITTAVAYWPCEDAVGSTTIASAMPAGTNMFLFTGVPVFATNSLCTASDPLMNIGTATFSAPIPAYVAGSRSQLRFILSVPSTLSAFLRRILTIQTSGTIRQISVFSDGTANNGGLAVSALDGLGNILFNSGTIAMGLNGTASEISIEWFQNGSNVTVNFAALNQGATSITQLGDTNIVSQTIGPASAIVLNPDRSADTGIAMGHISFHPTYAALTTLTSQIAAYAGESAGARLKRLCGEELVDFSYVGLLTDTALMGPQKSLTLLQLLTECSSADLGQFYETRGDNGLAYRTLTSEYNQAAKLDLNYANHVVASPFEPTDDDQQTRNDITVSREGGSSARYTLDTGVMSTQAPPTGAGRYTSSLTVNVFSDSQLLDIASWLVHLGTTNETRYPTITVNLASPDSISASLDSPAMAIECGDRLTISNPKSGQVADQIQQLMVGYQEILNAYVHSIIYNCVPASPYNVLALDTAFFNLDTDDSTLAAGATGIATSLSVATVAGSPLWTTTAGDMPFNIIVSGEVMTVTNITGGSSPQTFTVTRSVNGVAKAQSSGAKVSLQNPPYLAL